MKISELRGAIARVRMDPRRLTLQAITYLRTYPIILRTIRDFQGQSTDLFCQVATTAYGWMPRVARIDPDHLGPAIKAIDRAMSTAAPYEDVEIIRDIAACLHSVVGASKVLHFLAPSAFPIWDSKVVQVWAHNSETIDVNNPEDYVKYAKQVHAVTGRKGFDSFKSDFEEVYVARLKKLEIRRYSLTKVRIVEAAAFELIGGEYDDA